MRISVRNWLWVTLGLALATLALALLGGWLAQRSTF
jgi:hypothetical protein